MNQSDYIKHAEADNEYTILVQVQDDVIMQLSQNLDERCIYSSIIDGLERNVSDVVKVNKAAQIPYIGCVRKSPIKQAMRDNYTNFSIARKQMTKDQYKEHVKSTIVDAKIKQEQLDKRKYYLKKLRQINKVKYKELFINLGRAYAEAFIYSYTCFRIIDFDQEVQDAFDRINNAE